ncbi:MAG TPA: tRNA (N(6)-L-threonylcarbamoyladenosine(37)-C(2))-methylthiotransferase [Candidatus Aenigmarchaeota archaeon]|nr:MAG: threonylcarbamoyladenosine tRNA methylthiotransferase [Candidatus Aenigmarchaeota archaeon]HDD46514.1 tRNA (N(6)-L-threonylcarbamoyladenosine(37)-C(2))-methylthiotransferase [Candidatus Aenigmarchaeota archaeon]
MTSAYIESYGCTANTNHANFMRYLLKKEGFHITKSMDRADIIIINTCVVKQQTENKIISRIKCIKERFPDKILLITGCAVDAEYEYFKHIAGKAIFLSSHHTKDLIYAIKTGRDILGKRMEEKFFPHSCGVTHITEISQGCLGNCSFCITKNARGQLVSYSEASIIKDIEAAVRNGAKEILLTSQDNACYGLDRGTNLARLLKRICNIGGEFFIRVGMMNPLHIKGFLHELIDAYKDKKIYKFIHIPVQSGSDKILSLMNRGYKVSDFIRIIEEFRAAYPDLTLSTDIIVGFPYEKEEDFKKTIKLVKYLKPDVVNLSKFTVRKGTAAEKMKKIPSKIIKRRAREMATIIGRISKERNKKWAGWKGKILIVERGKHRNQFIGRNYAYKPVVVETKKNIMGSLVRVEINSYAQTHLFGDII